MPLVLSKRDEPIFPFKTCCCMDNRMGTFFGSIFVLITALLSLIFVSVDQYAVDHPSTFQISGSFDTRWRTLQYASWKACNVIMICAHMITVMVTFALVFSIVRRWRIYEVKSTLIPFNVWMWMYMIIELGIICFEYSWYTWHVFRLPWTCFIFVFWFLRLCFYVVITLVTTSYSYEINEELDAGLDMDKAQQEASPFQQAAQRYPSEPQIAAMGDYGQRPAAYDPSKMQPYNVPPGFTTGSATAPYGFGAPMQQPGSGYFGAPSQPPFGQPYTMNRGPPAAVSGPPSGWQVPPAGSMQSLPSAAGIPGTSFGGMQVNPTTIEDDF